MATADATLRPEAIALAVFGGIAGAATLLICGQVVARRIRLKSDELAVAPRPRCRPVHDALGGAARNARGGARRLRRCPVLIALALSPLAPLGPVRPYLAVAVHPDWTVLGLGAGALVVTLGTVAAVASLHACPGSWRRATRVSVLPGHQRGHPRCGLPPAAVAGVRFALEPGVGRSVVPVRSALLGAILAVTVVVATVTFGSSLNTLVSHPALYGWNWTYDIDGGGGLGDIPGTSRSHVARQGSLRGGLDRRVLLDAAAGRPRRAHHGDDTQCGDCATPAKWAHPEFSTSSGARRGRFARCTRWWATRSSCGPITARRRP